MFDIDRELEQLKIKEVVPDDQLVSRTMARIRSLKNEGPEPEAVSMAKERKKARPVLKWLPVALSFALVLMAVPFGLIPAIKALTDPAYYTIDINPSVELKVNNADTIVSVECKNNDALQLMAGIDCIGQNFSQVLPKIAAEAHRLGYIKDDKENYMLIARFGQSRGTITQEKLDALVTDATGTLVRVMYLVGTLQDKQAADEQEISAGLLLLGKVAAENGVDATQPGGQGKGTIGEIINCIDDEQDYTAPSVTGAIEDGIPVLRWGKIEHEAFMGYKVVASLNNPAPKYPEDGYLSYITDPNTTSMNLTGGDLLPGLSYYFSVTALYEGNVRVPGNAVRLTMPARESIVPTVENPYPSTPISGVVSGERVNLSWSRIASDAFVGYKVVASATNASPKYPEDGYIRYITNPDTTSLSVYEGFGGLQGNKNYYFSITVVYQGDMYASGNAVYLKVPDATQPEPTPTPESGDMEATTISGSIADGKVKLSWNKINHAQFSGYKVVKSATNPNPKYPDDGYMSYITNANTTSISYPLSNFDPNKTYYFSITVLYSDGTKKAGNAVSLTMPEGEPVPEMIATNISGSIDAEGKIHLSWNGIDHPYFEGYKVVYSKSPNPAYPSSPYKSWITNASTTSVVYDKSEFDAGSTYYFAITVVYNEHSVMKTGNDVAIAIP